MEKVPASPDERAQSDRRSPSCFQPARLLGYLPQEFGTYPRTSAEAMLLHFAALKGIHGAERRQIVESLLVRTNLWNARKRSVDKFSGGMKQRFGIAQALLGNPRLIIVDEPTAGWIPRSGAVSRICWQKSEKNAS